MKRVVIALFATVVGLGLFAQEAEAKRMGGSRSFGMSRDSSVMKRDAIPAKPAAPTQSAATAGAKSPSAAPQPSGMSRWMGPLAGLAAGIGLAALFSHLGMGEGMANFVMIALLAMAAVFVIRLLLRRSQPQAAPQLAGAGAGNGAEPVRFEAVNGVAGSSGASTEATSAPADFDVEGFLRQAKLNFIRLQAANDSGNMEDIKAFTQPEVYAEIEMQYRERKGASQQTDVVQLDASLLDVTSEDKRHVASVRFHGLIREAAEAAPEAFDEVWHLVKPTDGSGGWRVAGIQQA